MLNAKVNLLVPGVILVVLHCTALYCTVLYCTVLYCTVLYCTQNTVHFIDREKFDVGHSETGDSRWWMNTKSKEFKLTLKESSAATPD